VVRVLFVLVPSEKVVIQGRELKVTKFEIN
jgi:hypothetical protein